MSEKLHKIEDDLVEVERTNEELLPTWQHEMLIQAENEINTRLAKEAAFLIFLETGEIIDETTDGTTGPPAYQQH